VKNQAPKVAGVPYAAASTRHCQYVTDDTPFAQRFCDCEPAWRGGSWCPTHLAAISPRSFEKWLASQPAPQQAA
jgi:hypothetical protein